MTDRPIDFRTPSVLAAMDGRKTQHRLVLKPQPSKPWGSAFQEGNRWWTGDSLTGDVIETWRLRYATGDRLYVREAWMHARYRMDNSEPVPEFGAIYRADGCYEGLRGWKPSIHMLRWASRLTLTVTDVRVQRLKEISEVDARAEGADPSKREWAGVEEFGLSSDPFRYRKGFRELWNSLHGPDAWDANPWVVALTFTVQRGNIDKVQP